MANRKAGVRELGAELAALARPDDALVVDQEGYEQILFYSRLKGARRDLGEIHLSHEGESLVMETGSRSADRKGDAGAESRESRRSRAGASEPPRAAFAGALERARGRIVFPAGTRVLIVAAGPRVDRLRAQIGPSSRVLLATKIYGKPYCVISDR